MAGSFTHVPPGQLTFETQLKPAMPPAVEALQRFCRTSPPPGRNTSELRGRLTLAAPAQLPVPVALWARLLMTHVLAAGVVGFGMGSGAPKRHPHAASPRQCA